MPPDSTVRRILYPITAAAVLAFFLFFTWRSLGYYFDSDDMMNLYGAWSKPLPALLRANVFFWSDWFRPFGALFYRSIFALAGFNPLPFRIVCLGLGIANMALCFWFARLVTESERVAALAVLLFAFHTKLMEVWYRTGVVYDLLCFTFFYLAACLYVQARRRGGVPSLSRSAAIIGCYICALNSKEVAVALPVVLLGYEILFEQFRIKNLRLPALMALMNIPYILGKTTGAGAMTNNPAYRPEYTFDRFTHTWAIYLNFLFVRPEDIAPRGAVWILALTLGAALLLRSRNMIFAWLLLFCATLPVCFLSYRGGFVLYIAYAGWCLYAASLLMMPRYPVAIACAVFVLVGWGWGKVNLHDQRLDARAWLYDPPKLVDAMADQIRAIEPHVPRGARILFVEDAWGTNEWTPYFIVKLLYRDDTMLVDRIKMMDPKPADWMGYDYVFTYEAGRYRRLKP